MTQPAQGSPPQPPTNGMAIASLVMSLAAFTFAPLAIVGVILGVIALRQIADSPTPQEGYGLALAGIIIGVVWTSLLACGCFVAVLVALGIGAAALLGAAA